MQPLLAEVVRWEPAAWIFLGVTGALGLLAVISPARFTLLAARGGQWVDSNKILAALDKRVDIDSYVLPFSRYLGAALLASAVVIGYYLNQYLTGAVG